jgi:hypothetical protein
VNHERRLKGKREMHFHTDPPCFQDTLKVKGKVKVEDIDEGKCRVVMKGETEMNSWLNVGSVIESTIVNEIKRGYEILPKVVDEWKKRKAEGKSMTEGFDKNCYCARKGEPQPEVIPDATGVPQPAPQ